MITNEELDKIEEDCKRNRMSIDDLELIVKQLVPLLIKEIREM